MIKSKKLAVILLTSVFALGGLTLAACTENKEQPVTVTMSNITAEIRGYEWGPAIQKLVAEFSDEVKSVDKDTFTVKTGLSTRTVTKAYLCDADGKATDKPSKYIAIEMSVKYNEASPFTYSFTTERNNWTGSVNYSLTATKRFEVGKGFCEEGTKFSYAVTEKDRRVPQTESWNKDSVEYKENGKDITLTRASWAPEGAAADGGKNPLIIWLHGAGEGGTDIDIALLGNEVTALTTENETNVQHYFTNNTCKGSYVLAVQAPTMWMDDGTGKLNDRVETGGKQESYYTEALWKAITTYVDGNADVDRNRIYIGGCSNGGYMTMNLMFEHGDYFAAYYPVCEAYLNSSISNEMINQIKDYNVWFTLSEDDNTVNPAKYTLPAYQRMLEAGAENMRLTVLDHVYGVDDTDPQGGSPKGCYQGHWSWITVFNDGIKKYLDNSKINSTADMVSANCTVNGNLWQWLSEQIKQA